MSKEEEKKEKYLEKPSKFNYGYWRTDKEKVPGYSHELISSESEAFCKEKGTDLETLEGFLIPGKDTLIKCLEY